MSQQTDALPPHDAEQILLADDFAINRRIFAQMIAELGYPVTAVENGRAALNALQAQRFDLLLLDIEMPELDGWETARRIRRGEVLPENQTIPIIALTAYLTEPEKHRLQAIGINDFVFKTAEKRRLYCLIQQHLKLVPMPPVDERALADRFGHNPALLNQILEGFAQDAIFRMNDLKAGLENGDAEAAGRAAHKLANLSITVRAERAVELCRLLEARLKESKDTRGQSSLYDCLHQEIRRVLRFFKHQRG